MKILAFDVGGTKIASAVCDENGKILAEARKFFTPSTAEEIKSLIEHEIEVNAHDGLAIATAGVVFDNKVTGKPNNLPQGYQDIPFSELTKAPVLIENDANAALWAEFKIGNLRGVQNGIMLTLGTDVGCGIISNGQIIRGKNGAAGEVSFPFSGRDLKRLGAKYNVAQSDCFLIYQMAKDGDEQARLAYYEWEENLISGLKLLNGLLDTEIFALSGSLAQVVDYAKVSTTLALLQPQNPAVVKPAMCGTNAGLAGAALLYKEKYLA